MTLKVLSVTSEAVPLIKTGGLADVAGALPAAVAGHDVQMTTLLPGYPSVLTAISKDRARPRTVHTWDSLLGTPARVVATKLGEQPLLVLDAPKLYARDGAPYTDVAGNDWGDNWHRFSALGRAAADLAGGAMEKRGVSQGFDVVHAHDWQAAMACAYLRFAPWGENGHVPSVMTIHNMAFQGWCGGEIFGRLELPQEAWSLEGVENHGGVGMLKAGLATADAITTVSPTYAREIKSPEFGMGLEGLISARGAAVSGILNGIDTAIWDPARDKALAERYSHRTLEKREANKRALEDELGLVEDDGPLFVMVTRLTWQKGVDVLLEVLDHMVGIGGRLALLGAGDARFESELLRACARHPGRIGIRLGYDEGLSHRLLAGGDAILVPSRFEPCGLTQLYGLAYGCVPIVARTGGLADTVIDASPAALSVGAATGLQIDALNYYGFAATLSRAVELYRQQEEWRRLQRNGMKADFSWAASGKAYAELYRSLCE